jgi:hypothetical protein
LKAQHDNSLKEQKVRPQEFYLEQHALISSAGIKVQMLALGFAHKPVRLALT